MTALHSLAYKLDPALWVKDVVKIEPAPWQRRFMSAPRGASILALTARQVGKTTTAAWAIAHQMMFFPGSLSIIVCPAQRQSAEAVRRIREVLLTTNAEFANDNVYGLELKNGSRVMALPSTDDSVRGLTVTGWIIFDEAARLSEDLIAAVRPMRARQPATRLAMLSTAWSRTDPFWTAWTNEDADWIRFKMTADMPDCPLSPEQITKERVALSSHEFKREYLGIPAGGVVSPFGWELYDRATRILARSQRNAPVFNSRVYNDTDVASWPLFKPIIAHDVARSRDRACQEGTRRARSGPRRLEEPPRRAAAQMTTAGCLITEARDAVARQLAFSPEHGLHRASVKTRRSAATTIDRSPLLRPYVSRVLDDLTVHHVDLHLAVSRPRRSGARRRIKSPVWASEPRS
jgi:hypothetical protein